MLQTLKEKIMFIIIVVLIGACVGLLLGKGISFNTKSESHSESYANSSSVSLVMYPLMTSGKPEYMYIEFDSQEQQMAFMKGLSFDQFIYSKPMFKFGITKDKFGLWYYEVKKEK